MQQNAAALVQHHLDLARQAEQARDYAKAAEEYIKVLNLAPRSGEIHQKLGLVYHLQSKYQDAIVAFEKALALEPELWGASLFAGIDYYKTNQFSKAIPALQKALELNPKEAEFEARFWQGASHVALEQYGPGIEQLQRAAKLKPGDIEVLYNLAQAQKKYSAQLFDRILKKDPDSPRVYQLQAETYQALGRVKEAIEEYKLALSRRPNLEGIHLEMGKLYRQIGNVRVAAEEFEMELRINPYDGEAQYRLEEAQRELNASTSTSATISRSPGPYEQKTGDVSGLKNEGVMTDVHALKAIGQFHGGQWKEAADTFEQVLERYPQDKLSRLYLARSLGRLGRNEEAVQTLETLLNGPEADADTLYTLGKIQAELASLGLQRMIDIDPNSHRVQQLVGEDYEKKEQYGQALEYYKAALALKPDLPGIRFSIGSMHWKMGQFDQALRWLQEELKTNPHHPLVHYQLGNIYVSRHQPTLALPHLQETVLARPQFVEARRELGKTFVQLGRFEKAIEQLRIVAQAEPDDDAVHALMANAYRRQGRMEEAKAELELSQQLNQKRLERSRRRLEKAQ